MTTWNYRAGYRTHDGEQVFGIYEVHYEGGFIVMWSVDQMAPSGDTAQELADDLALMASAFDLPVLDIDNLKAGVIPAPPRSR